MRGTPLTLAPRRFQVAGKPIEIDDDRLGLRRLYSAPINALAQLAEAPVMAPLVAACPGLRLPGARDGFELAVRAILGQQITVPGATAGRLVATCGTPLGPELARPGLSRAFPRPERLVHADLARLGMPGARARALSSIAAISVADLGIAMRAVREPDALPATDVSQISALADDDGTRPNAAEVAAGAEAWRPWRAYATLHFWMANRGTPPATRPQYGDPRCASRSTA